MKRDRRFRPMGTADILDETVELYRSGFVLLVGMAALVYVPFFLIDGLLKGHSQPTSTSELPGYLGVAVIELVILLIVGTFVTGAMTFAISDKYLGRETTIGGCLAKMIKPRVFAPFLLAILLKYVLVVLPAVLLFLAVGLVSITAMFSGSATPAIALFIAIPFIIAAPAFMVYILVRLALVEPCFILEMPGIRGAISRSWTLVRGYVMKAFLVLAIPTVVLWLVQALLTTPTQIMITLRPEGAGDPSHLLIAANLVIGTVSSALFMPVISIVTILLYYDLRIRREGFDLEMLAQDLDFAARREAVMNPALPQEETSPPDKERPA